MSGDEDQIALLGKVPLFSACTPEELSEASACLSSMEVRAGTVLVREGDPGDSMYIIAAGTVRIVAKSSAKETIAAVAPIAQFVVASMRVRQTSARPTMAR